LKSFGIRFHEEDKLPILQSKLKLKLKKHVDSIDSDIVQLANAAGHDVVFTPCRQVQILIDLD
jgi:hypothetical protein